MAIERQLWCSVIQLAWDDYFASCPTWKQGISDWKRNRREAKAFLTRSTGDWARSRSDVCYAAGIDPDALRDAALEVETAKEKKMKKAMKRKGPGPGA